MSNYRTELIQVAAVCLAAAQVDEVDTTALGIGTREGARGLGSLENLLSEVREERKRQEIKWGTRTGGTAHPHFWFLVLAEEFGEVAEEVIRKIGYKDGPLSAAVVIGEQARAKLEAR